MIRSRSSRRKWIYDPITILKKEDLDPKGSRSDHDLGISAFIGFENRGVVVLECRCHFRVKSLQADHEIQMQRLKGKSMN